MSLGNERRHRPARHILHDEVRQSAICRSGIKNPCNVWMIEGCESFAFCAEPLHEVARLASRLENLDGDLLFEITVGSRGKINTAHATMPQRLHNDVGANPLACLRKPITIKKSGHRLSTFFQ